MNIQKEAFLAGEGDGWYGRNRLALDNKHNDADEVLAAIKGLQISPQRVLEIGCANGWRLDLIRSLYGAECNGIEPSSSAIEDGSAKYPELTLDVGTADHLAFEDGRFDIVIYGFCLYLCDRADLFRIVTEGDRVLSNCGYMIIYDFHAEIPHRNRYKHAEGLCSYKMDHSKLFLSSPIYRRVYQKVFSHNSGGSLDEIDSLLSVTVLRKSVDIAFPEL